MLIHFHIKARGVQNLVFQQITLEKYIIKCFLALNLSARLNIFMLDLFLIKTCFCETSRDLKFN